MQLKKCQIFTPPKIVSFMLDSIGYKKNIFGKKIIDNSCGNGSFLVEILQRFLQDAKRKRVSRKEIKKNIEQCIVGYEIDKNIYNDCIIKLNEIAAQYKINNICWNVHCANGLLVDKYNFFDFVVGNPPYIAYKDLDDKERADVKKMFISCSKGKFDYSYAFIEKGLNLLKPYGKMTMISPANMFKTVDGKALRELIKPHLTSIINCSRDKIFDKVLTSPSITVYQKEKQLTSIKYKNGLEKEFNFIDKSKLIDKWIFDDRNNGTIRFGDYFKVSNSIATLSNKIFIHDVDDNGQVIVDGECLEEGILKIAKSPRSEMYSTKQKIIFPYKYNEKTLVHIEEEELKLKYPNAYQYLLDKKVLLSKRDSDHGAKWYEYGRSQALIHLNQKKLMLSSIITKKVKVYELDTKEIPYSGMYIVPIANKKLKIALRILKSKKFYHYILSIGIPLSGDSIRISSKDVENFKFGE